MITGRDVVIYFSVKYAGDWSKIYNAMQARENFEEEDVLTTVGGLRCQVVTIIDENYPAMLKRIYKPPFALFYYGDLSLSYELDSTLAVVGSRECSDYGLKMTTLITSELVNRGLTIISGLAKGIDAAAHLAAMNNKGKTIAVLGSGIDNCYPRENFDLYNEVKLHHLVMSEYPGDTAPDREHFPWRNRIIAALAKGVFVAEAHRKSGTLITVGYALYLGRDVFVLPHPADTDTSCNRLIKDGAILIESAQDIIDELNQNVGESELKGAPKQ
ncbi:MAG: DNA-processing protein DprA [Firmicutes bacterium]|nr:DNA-processing protein DprA [Bacillota bacterium]